MVDAIFGNIHVNQVSPLISAKLGNVQGRYELQSLKALEAINAKKIEIEKTRPAEATHQIDPQREHERKKHEEEEQNASFLKKHVHGREEEVDEDTPQTTSSNHIIDIKV